MHKSKASRFITAWDLNAKCYKGGYSKLRTRLKTKATRMERYELKQVTEREKERDEEALCETETRY